MSVDRRPPGLTGGYAEPVFSDRRTDESAVRVVALSGGAVGTSMLDVLAAHGCVPVAVIASHAAGARGVACPSTAAWCERHRVPWAYWPRLRGETAAEDWLREQRAELLLSLSYDLILPASLLRLADRAINIHRGLALKRL